MGDCVQGIEQFLAVEINKMGLFAIDQRSGAERFGARIGERDVIKPEASQCIRQLVIAGQAVDGYRGLDRQAAVSRQSDPLRQPDLQSFQAAIAFMLREVRAVQRDDQLT